MKITQIRAANEDLKKSPGKREIILVVRAYGKGAKYIYFFKSINQSIAPVMPSH